MQRIPTILATFVIAMFAVTNDIRAGLIISAPSIVTTPGASGSFDVTIHNDNGMGGASYNIASFSLELSLSGAPGVQFTAVDILTSISYVFIVSGGPPFSFDMFPNTSFIASDSEFDMTGPGYRIIAPGQTYGLAHVSYTVDANAALGHRHLIVDNLGTSLSDEMGQFVDFMPLNGNLNVVPEPSTGVLLSMGMVCAVFAFYRRTRRTSSVSSTLRTITRLRLPV